MIATTPEPPYYAVIFTSLRTDVNQGYARMADRMTQLAARQSGYLGAESVRNADGVQLGITVSYWRDLASIAAWKADGEHLIAQQAGQRQWYAHYRVRIAKVERDYGWAELSAEPALATPAPPPSA